MALLEVISFGRLLGRIPYLSFLGRGRQNSEEIGETYGQAEKLDSIQKYDRVQSTVIVEDKGRFFRVLSVKESDAERLLRLSVTNRYIYAHEERVLAGAVWWQRLLKVFVMYAGSKSRLRTSQDMMTHAFFWLGARLVMSVLSIAGFRR